SMSTSRRTVARLTRHAETSKPIPCPSLRPRARVAGSNPGAAVRSSGLLAPRMLWALDFFVARAPRNDGWVAADPIASVVMGAALARGTATRAMAQNRRMGAILAADIVGFCYLTEPRVQARSIDPPGASKPRRDKSITSGAEGAVRVARSDPDGQSADNRALKSRLQRGPPHTAQAGAGIP